MCNEQSVGIFIDMKQYLILDYIYISYLFILQILKLIDAPQFNNKLCHTIHVNKLFCRSGNAILS